MADPRLYIGLMSGTSLDSIDAALVEIPNQNCTLLYTLAYPLQASLRDRLLDLCTPGSNEIERMGRADRELGLAFASAALALLEKARLAPAAIAAIGSHGQTIRHNPTPNHNLPGYTLQIGDPNTIAYQTGITTVSDFRRKDIAAGGQGAPLVPAFHADVFAKAGQDRVIVNIGGMANITLLKSDGSVLGFDTGPGNVLMDSWIQKQLNKPFDQNGNWANTGNINNNLLSRLSALPYFKQPPPKSTGRELFNLNWLESHLAELTEELSDRDIQRTILELTAQTITAGIQSLKLPAYEVYLCGGGVHNQLLTARLENLLKPNPVRTTTELGIEPDWVEAAAFAWLAKQTINHLPGNYPEVTGAKSPEILGGVYFACFD